MSPELSVDNSELAYGGVQVLTGVGAPAAFRSLAARGVAAQGDVLVANKFVPNPYGRLGGPEHQAVVADIVADIERRGLTSRTEFHVPTPNGDKGSRFVDVVAIDPVSKLPTEFYQVGRQTRAGNPVARETRAIRDVERVTNQPITFKPYN